jgi:CMP-N,N'-diacetyllegionaminic acid synthase
MAAQRGRIRVTWQNKTVLAVIPARGNSKGIPRKNLRTVGGISLIAHTARVAKALPWLDAAVLSTDDDEMAEEGRRCGLDVPFRRPADLATDSATSVETWRHAWLESERHFERRFDVSLLLQPTTPLRRPLEVERTVRTLVEGGHQAAATVGRVPGDFAPGRCMTLGDDGTLSFYSSEGAQVTRRQDFPTLYFRDGTCYAVTRECLVDRGHIVEEDCAAVLIDRFVVNIDEPFELELAEFLLARDRESD